MRGFGALRDLARQQAAGAEDKRLKTMTILLAGRGQARGDRRGA